MPNTGPQPRPRPAATVPPRVPPTAPFMGQAFTLAQPLAWATVAGFCSVHVSSWLTPYRGTLAIHASVSHRDFERLESALLEIDHPDVRAELNADYPHCGYHPVYCGDQGEPWAPAHPYHYGAIIGTVELIDCVPTKKLLAREDDAIVAEGRRPIPPQIMAEFGRGPYCWIFDTPRRLKMPIPSAGGTRRISPLAPEIFEQLRAALANPDNIR